MPELVFDGTLPGVLAVGAHLKNVAAFSVEGRILLSDVLGDMELPDSIDALERAVRGWLDTAGTRPVALAHDRHPGYVTTGWAEECAWGELDGLPRIAVQHHHAHLAACLADSGHRGAALGIIWDGTGYGTDGTVWGGEFLLGHAREFERTARLRRFSLPGGERAVREPRRTALALLWELDDPSLLRHAPGFTPGELALVTRMLERGVNAPRTSSMGRLFDGVAALAGLHPQAEFEAQAAIALEQAVDPTESGAYALDLDGDVVDWRPLVADVLRDVGRSVPLGRIAARFHNALVELALVVARRSGAASVALSGGCFQNRVLATRVAERLSEAGLDVLTHRALPPTDGGIAAGQVAVASARMRELEP
jgi:hydrogenase maturation protein HypF